MPFPLSNRRGRILAAAAVLALLIAAPAQAARVVANPYDCAPQPTLSHNFAQWGDFGLYTPVLNAGLEDGSTGWHLTNGAAVVDGNEPWHIGGASDGNALSLPGGSSATTAPLCIDETYPYFRMFARNAGADSAGLKIDVIFYDRRGRVLNTVPYYYMASNSEWAPTPTIKISVFTPATTVSAAPVAFRFSPMGPNTRFVIDDVYVDPWARG